MGSRNILVIGLLAICVAALVGVWLTISKNNDLTSKNNDLTDELASINTQFSRLTKLFPALSERQLTINNLEGGKAELRNPFFAYHLTYDQRAYTVDIASWAEVLIGNPANKGSFILINATSKDSKEFPGTRYLDFDARAGYVTDRKCETSSVEIGGKSATKYVCGDYSKTYYLLTSGDYKYSIVVSSLDSERAKTTALLNGFSFLE